MMAVMAGRPIDAYADRVTLDSVATRFDYAFTHRPGSGYPPFVVAHEISGPLTIGAIDVVPFPQIHGDLTTLGLRFGKLGYSTDVVELPEEAFEALAGIDTWIVGCLRYDPHPTHAHLDLVLDWAERLKPRRTILTHMGHTLDYDEVKSRCPPGVEPGHDGMVIELKR